LAHNSDEHAGILRERVTSKGGTTAAALEVMKHHGWHEILEKAIDAASQRGKTMGDELVSIINASSIDAQSEHNS
jgi:pyrroline-5-carboxylate reductase